MPFILTSLIAVMVCLGATCPPAAWAQTNPPASGSVLVEEDVIVVFADEPRLNFRDAVTDFLNRQPQAAATDIRKAVAYMKMESGRATAEGKKLIQTSVQELEKLAGEMQKGAVADLKDMQHAFVRAEYALAQHHYLKAVESHAKNDAQKTGQALQSSADYIDSGQVWMTRKMNEGADDVTKEARRIGAKLLEGSTVAATEAGKAFDGLGKELDAFKNKVAEIKK